MEALQPYAIREGQTVRNWADFLPPGELLFPETPKIGLVVGTFAALPYVHLHLETCRLFHPSLPVLIHDDCSPHNRELEQLCARYRVDFVSTTSRFPSCKGDLSAIASGLNWARERSLPLLVKMSRRFLPLKPWAGELGRLAVASQYATYSSWTTSFNFGFRTECLGFAVDVWFGLGLFEEIVSTILQSETPFVEGFIHRLARRAAIYNCQTARSFDLEVGARPRERDGYAVWPFIGTDRCAPTDNFLWHDWAAPSAYAARAKALGLPYCEADFLDPNAGS